MSPLISIVIPAYNAAGKIESTLESLLAQDYEAIEVIVVDDASPDGTKSVAKNILQTARFQWRIEMHEKNRGVSAARNTGMAVARGEYIVFMDADDLAEKEYVSGLCGAVCTRDSDLAFCGHKVYDEGTGETVSHPICLSVDIDRDAQDYVIMLLTKKFHAGIWSMIFKRRFIEENALSFYEGCSAGEDVEFVTKAFSVARTISFTPDCLYIYRHHDGMGSRACVDTFEKRITRYEENTEAHVRTAEFAMQRAASQKVRDMAEKLLLPEAYIRRFTVCARKKERETFDQMLASREIRTILWGSRKYAQQKPEVFLKALWLLVAPGAYYALR